MKGKSNQKSEALESARRIRSLRRALDKNKKEFAELLGISQTTASEWESGDYVPSGQSYAKLSTFETRLSAKVWFLQKAGLAPKEIVEVAGLLSSEMETAKAGVEIVHVPPATGGDEKDVALPFTRWMVPGPETAYYARVRDSFMEPAYLQGDIVLIDPRIRDVTDLEGELVAIFVKEPRTATEKLQLKRAQESMSKHSPDKVEDYRKAGRYPFHHFGLSIERLRREVRSAIEEDSVVGQNIVGKLVPHSVRKDELRFETNEDVVILGRVTARIRPDGKND